MDSLISATCIFSVEFLHSCDDGDVSLLTSDLLSLHGIDMSKQIIIYYWIKE